MWGKEMYFKQFFSFLIIFLLGSTVAHSSQKQKIIEKLDNIQNVSFNFSQVMKDKIEEGNCKIHYPKKIFCKYSGKSGKILVSNGKTLVIKVKRSGAYYIYPIEKTPLNLILDKNYLIEKINEIKISDKEKENITLEIKENNQNLQIFFDKKNFVINGWKTTDIYNNENLMIISAIKINESLNDKIFILPKRD